MIGSPAPTGRSTSAANGAAPPAADGWMPPERGAGGIDWERHLAALRRYRRLVLLVLAGGILLGILLALVVQPRYEVRSTVWIANEESDDRSRGPFQGDPLLEAPAWAQLITSFSVLDRVVNELALFVTPEEAEDSVAFRDFGATDRLVPGEYLLRLDNDKQRYVLERDGNIVERGVLGDSVGRSVGFAWRPTAAAFGDDGKVEFTVVPLREASRTLRRRLTVELADSSFITLTLVGTEPARDAAILNEIGREFSALAMELERRNHAMAATLLARQLAEADSALGEAERDLALYRSSTITRPAEAVPMATGVAGSGDPVLASFYTQKAKADSARQERVALQRVLAGSAGDAPINVGALLAIPSVREAPELRAAIDELIKAEATLASLRRTYTEEYRPVADLQQSITRLRTQTIPALAERVLARLRAAEREYQQQVSLASRELRAMPSRTAVDTRLARDAEVKAELYRTLKERFEAARMAEASAIPPVAVLDSAMAPIKPTRATSPYIFLLTVLIALVIAAALVILLDRRDPRLRYPTQATRELGVPILGAISSLHVGAAGPTAEETAQVLEAFRTLRLNLRHALPGAGPVLLTVTSPGAGEGKSFVSSNLALAFAEAGYRTLLVDGDVRRGALHETLGLHPGAGLTDVLLGNAQVEEVLQQTSDPNLVLLPSGSRVTEGPELLMSSMLPRLIGQTRLQFNAVIVDSAPLAAGADPLVLGTATENMLLVLRVGQTDRQLAQMKLEQVDQLPIRLLGAVLNDVRTEGQYRYYGFLPEYAMSGGEYSGHTRTVLVPHRRDHVTGPDELTPAGTA